MPSCAAATATAACSSSTVIWASSGEVPGVRYRRSVTFNHFRSGIELILHGGSDGFHAVCFATDEACMSPACRWPVRQLECAAPASALRQWHASVQNGMVAKPVAHSGKSGLQCATGLFSGFE